MSGSMTGIYVGVSGLQTSQNGLNTTAHNIANADTKGYSRQQVLLKDTYYQTIGVSTTSKMQVGYGDAVDRLRQLRNEFLDTAYRKETGRQGFYEAQYSAVSEVEDIFGETEGVPFKSSIDTLWTSISELQKQSDNKVARDTLVASADSFIKRAQIISGQLKDYQTSLNTEVKSSVDKINSYVDQINDLNKQIQKVECAGVERANDLRDSRNLLLDKLGKLTDISYKEISGGSLYVFTEGHLLVGDGDVNHMKVELMSNSSSPATSTSSMYNVKWEDTNTEVYNFDNLPSSEKGTDVGYLKGLLLARGDDTANYTDIPGEAPNPMTTDYQDKLDRYNKVISNSTIMLAEGQFDKLINGIVTAINNVLCPVQSTEVDVAVDASNQPIVPPATATAPYTTKKYKILSEDAPVGSDDNNTPGNVLFERKNQDSFQKMDLYVVDSGTGTATKKTCYVYQEPDETDPYSLYTTDQLEVNQNLQKNSNLMPLSKAGGTGDIDVKTAEELINVWRKDFSTLDPNSLTKYTFYGYYTGFVGELANAGEVYKTVSNTQDQLANDIESQRQAVAGVSTDEELTNLIKYQHAYNAASRYINVVSQMLEDIVTKL
ncbi:flagellar hook-associated protein FlgK [Anaeromicropila herbilytica]|uniref:Flagellar hook-associated protein 1 n=1 Tax=Anaeromicropila herbilytica TaxID=2785025 RepID=A0A7R7EPB6_9FIRM|nr:flagellar hook-associated protein FlgK [Anaeromicropila herbilytica]BCN32561.1 hypothetical protein bsdtb5_38560 [Anaeromicropila herbilytica]